MRMPNDTPLRRRRALYIGSVLSGALLACAEVPPSLPSDARPLSESDAGHAVLGLALTPPPERASGEFGPVVCDGAELASEPTSVAVEARRRDDDGPSLVGLRANSHEHAWALFPPAESRAASLNPPDAWMSALLDAQSRGDRAAVRRMLDDAARAAEEAR